MAAGSQVLLLIRSQRLVKANMEHLLRIIRLQLSIELKNMEMS